MKFSSKDLMKAMGLQVGDKVKIGKLVYIIDYDCVLKGIGHNEDLDCYGIHMLVGIDYEILPRQKCVGDLKCGTQGKDGQNTCGDCPVRIICNHHTCKELGCGNTLYEYLETYKTNLFEDYVYDFDQEIYDLLKARLNKEVE